MLNMIPSINIEVVGNRLVMTRPDQLIGMATASVSSGYIKGEVSFDETFEWTDEYKNAVQAQCQSVLDSLSSQYLAPLASTATMARSRAIKQIMTTFNARAISIVNNVVSEASNYLEELDEVEKKFPSIANRLSGYTITPIVPDAGGPIVEPDPDPIYSEGQTVSYLGSISSQFLKNGSTLFAGTGIPGTDKYKVVSNDIIELALSAHLRSQWDNGRIIGEDGSYELTLADLSAAARWVVSWSIGNKMPLAGSIADLYDIQLIMNSAPDGTENADTALVFNMTFDSESNNYVFDAQFSEADNISDSGYNTDMTCIQNSSSYHWYKVFMTPIVEPTSAVHGMFVVELRAVHKATGNVTSNKILVSADVA